MSKIFRPACFKVCTCGQHGRIIFSDGSEGKEVTSETEAMTQLVQACADGKILEVEVEIVREQIINSPLSSFSDIPLTVACFVASALASEIVPDPDELVSRRPTNMNKVCTN